MYNYGFVFEYRKNEGDEPVKERFFIKSSDKNIVNACEIAMLQFIKKHNYFSAKLIRTINY